MDDVDLFLMSALYISTLPEPNCITHTMFRNEAVDDE